MGQRDCTITGARTAAALDEGTLCRQRSTPTGPAGSKPVLAKAAPPPRPLRKVGEEFPAELRPMREAYERELAEYIGRHRHTLTKWLAIDNGTASNFIGGSSWMLAGFAALMTWRDKSLDTPEAAQFWEFSDDAHDYWIDAMESSLRTGCLDLQSRTLRVLNEHPAQGWRIKRWMVGNVMEHHAVNVHPEGGDTARGWVFDPWVTLSPEVYAFSDWQEHFTSLSWLGSARAE
jgi:hypothetical protein